jgi:23S rRNA pseudouridine1911/1915/1917 synthase
MDHGGPPSSRRKGHAAGSEWVVGPLEAGRRLVEFLAAPERLGSRGRVKRALERGKVILNDEDVLPEHGARTLDAGDILRLWVDRPGSAQSRRRPVRGTDRLLPVVYEDASLLVVNKPAGLLTVPLVRRPGATSAEDLLAQYLRSKGKRRAWVVHRIDRDTSGLVVFAANPAAREALKAQFARREPERVYLAVVTGTPDPPSGVWRDHLRWDPTSLAQLATAREDARARQCVSEYEVLESFAQVASLICVRLRTGRRNQIRVQAQQHGHPLIGERMYVDTAGTERGPTATRQALHAWWLGFAHPETGRWIQLEAPLPEDLQRLLSRLRETERSGGLYKDVGF